MSFTEVHDAINFALATLGGASNQGDACNALRGAKVVLHRLEAANAPAAPVVPVDPAVAAPDANLIPPETNPTNEDVLRVTAGAQGEADKPAEQTSSAPAIVVQTAPHETLAEKIEHAVEGALGIAQEPTA